MAQHIRLHNWQHVLVQQRRRLSGQNALSRGVASCKPSTLIAACPKAVNAANKKQDRACPLCFLRCDVGQPQR